MKRNAPYRHADGSNCWTKNCSRNKHVTQESSAKPVRSQVTPPTVLPPLSAFLEANKAFRVEATRHRTLPYVTFKYSRATQFHHDWDDVTLSARGIIFNEQTGEVVARPFSKFFNHGEPEVPTGLLTGPVSVTEKLDGSLGIGYRDLEGRMLIASSGSFHSEQAEHANSIYQERYEGQWDPDPERTYLWEVIYPGNRVVVNYGDEDDIHLIGAVNIRTGRSVPVANVAEWKWKKAVEHTNLTSLSQVLASPDRENHEGFILHYPETDVRVKYKHEEYLRYHRAATGVTAKTIWRLMRNNEDFDTWMVQIPEEFEGFVLERRNKIQADFNQEIERIKKLHKHFAGTLPAGSNRKDFALKLFASDEISHEDKPYLMQLEATGRVFSAPHLAGSIWDRVKPSDELAFWNM